jgi:hypothetical protein
VNTVHQMAITLDGIGHIISDTRLAVPRFQRSYAWTDRHVTDMFKDIGAAIGQGDTEYFLGSIVLIGSGYGRMEVVDGQQRLATITILLAAFRDYFVLHHDQERADDIQHTYIMKRDMRSRERINNLVLNDTDTDYFSKRILSGPLSDERNVPQTRESHKRIDAAARLAAEHVELITKPVSNPSDVLMDWIDYIMDNVRVIRVQVPDDANALQFSKR